MIGRSLTFQMMALFIGRALAFVLTFAVPLVLVRIFSPEEFGLYKQLFLIHSTLISILALGFSASLFYFLPCHPDQAQSYISQTLFVLFAAGLCGALGLVIFKTPLAELLNNPELSSYIPYLAVFTCLSLVTELIETLMVTFKRAELAAVTYFLSELLRGSLIIAAAVLTHSMIVLIAACAVWSLLRVIALIAYLNNLPFSLWLKPQSGRLAQQFRYAMPFGLALLIRGITEGLPQYAVSYFYDPLLFAVYSVGYLQIPAVSIAADSIAEVTLVRLTELRNSGLFAEALSVLAGSVSKLCLFLFPLYGWLLINARELIVFLFTERFESSAPLFQIFLATIPLTALGLDYVPRAFADTTFVFRVNVARFVATAVLLAILMPYFGLIGAAIATVIGIGTAKLIILVRVKDLFRTSLRKLLPWKSLSKIAGVTLAAAVCAGVVGAALVLPVVAKLAVSGALFALCYSAAIWKTDILEKADKDKVSAVLRNLTRLDKTGWRLMYSRLFGGI